MHCLNNQSIYVDPSGLGSEKKRLLPNSIIKLKWNWN